MLQQSIGAGQRGNSFALAGWLAGNLHAFGGGGGNVMMGDVRRPLSSPQCRGGGHSTC